MPRPEELYGPGTTTLITGASSGIGEALAVRLARHGGALALQARRADRLEQVARRVRDAGASALVLEGDVRDLGETRTLAARVRAELGPVDVAFLNAGLGGPTFLKRFSAEEVRYMFEVNVFGVVNWLGELLPPMLERGRGVITATSSIAALRGVPTGGAYSASKAAVSTLMESLRAEARAAGVQLGLVECGFFRSELTDKNKFPMPLLMEADRAAEIVERQVAAGRERIRFPWPMAGAMQAMRALPDPLFDLLGTLAARTRG